MITPFTCKPTPHLIFGQGKFSSLPDILNRFGSCFLVITGSSSFIDGPHWQPFIQGCEENSFSLVFEQIGGEPSPEQIDQICNRHQGQAVDAVVAIGGGSTLDAGKAVSAMLVEQKPVFTLLEGVGTEQPSGNKLPFIAIPTTSGTGSEATSNAVLSKTGSDGFKKSLRHDNYIPDIALIDPELTASCPLHITATCGMDTFTQLVEAYLSTKGSPITDALALDGIRAVVHSLKRACESGKDIDARSDLAYASYLSGIVLANAGLGAVHGLAGPLGGLFPLPHGVACGLLMAPINRLTLARVQASDMEGDTLNKYRNLGKIVSGSAHTPDPEAKFISYIESLSQELLPMRLSTYGISSNDIAAIIAKGSNKNNPAQLSEKEFADALSCLMDDG